MSCEVLAENGYEFSFIQIIGGKPDGEKGTFAASGISVSGTVNTLFGIPLITGPATLTAHLEGGFPLPGTGDISITLPAEHFNLLLDGQPVHTQLDILDTIVILGVIIPPVPLPVPTPFEVRMTIENAGQNLIQETSGI
jgi:hypothetical protein